MKKLDMLKTGDQINFRISRIRKKGRESKEYTGYSFCWRDNYCNQDVLIFAKTCYELIPCCIFPKEWISSDKNDLIITEPYFENPSEPCNFYNYKFNEREYFPLINAIRGESPTQEQIIEFKNSQLYFNFFKKTPIYEMMIEHFKKVQSI